MSEFTQHDDDVLIEAVQKMETCFRERSIRTYGEMLHMFSLRMLYSEAKYIDCSTSEVEAQCNEYIDEISANGKMQVGIKVLRGASESRSGYENQAFYVLESYRAKFDKLHDKVNSLWDDAVSCAYRRAGRKIEWMIANDIDAFERTCTDFFDIDDWIYNLRAYTAIAPDSFVKTWLSSSKVNWVKVLCALMDHFSRNDKRSHSSEQIEWLGKVVAELDRQLLSAAGMDSIRIQQLVSSRSLRLHWLNS